MDKNKKNIRAEVRCVIRQRGQSKLEQIQGILANSYTKDSVKTMMQKYSESRKKYSGSHTFGFSENLIPRFVGDYFKKESMILDAVTLLEAN